MRNPLQDPFLLLSLFDLRWLYYEPVLTRTEKYLYLTARGGSDPGVSNTPKHLLRGSLAFG